MSEMLQVRNVGKGFVLHGQGAVTIPVLEKVNFSLKAGECIAIAGESGAGKSTFMRMIYANYLCSSGNILIRCSGNWIDMTKAAPNQILDIRRRTLGYVSQFLRVIPRVSTLEIVAEPLLRNGISKETAIEEAKGLLARLRIPERLWELSPLTFSGGEQQRVNIARGFIVKYPIMLLDEPTASLDAENRKTVLDLIQQAKYHGSAILGIFHDQAARDAVCTDIFDITQFQVA